MTKRVLLTGSNGFVGRAVRRLAPKEWEFLCPTSQELDLRNRRETHHYFNHAVYDVVIHCASKVAGLGGHKGKHSRFLNDNILINANVLDVCNYNNSKLIAVSSVAAFPGNVQYLTEDNLENGPVHKSEFGYAISKRLIDTQIQLYREEYGSNFCCLFPTNLYGRDDNFSLETGHIIPSLIHRFYKSSLDRNKPYEKFLLWGDGLSLRQFLYVDDFARIILQLSNLEQVPNRMICSNDGTWSINDVAHMINNVSGLGKMISWDKDPSKNGLRVREVDNSRMMTFCKEKQISLTNLSYGIDQTWAWFVNNYQEANK